MKVFHRKRVRKAKEENKAWVRSAAAKAVARKQRKREMPVASKVIVVGVASGITPKVVVARGRVYERDPGHQGSGTKRVPDEQHEGRQASGP